MKILVQLQSSNEQLCHEGLSLAFALASFDHHIQLWLGDDMTHLLYSYNHQLTKMLTSLDLYDMPPAWTTLDLSSIVYPPLQSNLSALPEKICLDDFDSILNF